MKFLGVTVLVALISLGGVNCSSVVVSTNNVQVSCSVPIEDVWTDLSRGKTSIKRLMLFQVYLFKSRSPKRCTQWGLRASPRSVCLNKSVNVSSSFKLFVEFFLLQVHRYPVIKSGDQIVLRSAHSSYSQYLMYCGTSYCQLPSCSGSQSMTKSLWSSCSSYSKFYITAFGRVHGEPINSGDTVSLSSVGYGSSYRLRCTSSSSWYCRLQS